jgi:hypothetical protein
MRKLDVMKSPSTFQWRVLRALYLLTCIAMSGEFGGHGRFQRRGVLYGELRAAAKIPARQGFVATLLVLRDAGLVFDFEGLSLRQTWKLTKAGKKAVEDHLTASREGSGDGA